MATDSPIPLRPAPRDVPWLLPVLAALLCCSGASALIYQVIWLRQLGLVFGVTVYAASTVWASFMTGLACGSFVAGRVADRVRRPLLWFAASEALIGTTALLTPAGLGILQQWYVSVHGSLPQNAAVVTLLRVLMTLAVLFVPTLLMGATLPLVVKSSLIRAERLGPRVGLLYGSNTAGAILGTLASGLLLIPQLGMASALQAAAALNLLVALIAAAVALTRPPVGRGVPAASDTAAAPPADALPRRIRLTILAVFTLSGLASLALEVIWFRVVVLLIRPTVYGFAIMLATLLFGIAAGSYVAASLLRRPRRWLAPLAAIELAMALTALCSLQTLVFLPRLSAAIVPSLDRWIPHQGYSVTAAVLTILPTALLMGVAFPIGLRLWTGGGDEVSPVVARRIGSFYSLNVAGSIVGSLAAGFVLLPVLGSRWSLVVVCGIMLASGLALIAQSDLRVPWRWSIGVLFAGAFAGASVYMDDPFDLFLRLRYPSDTVIWREEGVQATVSVHRIRNGLVLNLEGNHQASDTAVGLHRAIGHLAMLVHPEPRDALAVGLGGGATAGAVAIHSGADVDIVELSRGVVRAARLFRTSTTTCSRGPTCTCV